MNLYGAFYQSDSRQPERAAGVTPWKDRADISFQTSSYVGLVGGGQNLKLVSVQGLPFIVLAKASPGTLSSSRQVLSWTWALAACLQGLFFLLRHILQFPWVCKKNNNNKKSALQ